MSGRVDDVEEDVTELQEAAALGVAVPVRLRVTTATETDTGDAETAAGFRYDAWTLDLDPDTDTPTIANTDPTAGDNEFARPDAGFTRAATFGYAHKVGENYALGWINEITEQEACGTEEEEEE